MAGNAASNSKELLSSKSEESIKSPVLDEKPKPRSNSVSSSSTRSSELIEIVPYDEFAQPTKVTSKEIEAEGLHRHRTAASVATNATNDPGFEVDFADDDLGDPKQFPMWKRALIIFFISYSTLVVYVKLRLSYIFRLTISRVMYSTSYTAAVPGIMITFHLTDETIAVLGITTYLIGMAVGSVILAPLSEM
jgi:hypothetical protein